MINGIIFTRKTALYEFWHVLIADRECLDMRCIMLKGQHGAYCPKHACCMYIATILYISGFTVYIHSYSLTKTMGSYVATYCTPSLYTVAIHNIYTYTVGSYKAIAIVCVHLTILL